MSVQFIGPLSVIEPSLADHAEAVVREAVSNTVRHAGASELSVVVRVEDDLSITITDNGRGMDDNITASGLLNLRRRAEEVGGDLTIGTGPAGGTVLSWTAPLPDRRLPAGNHGRNVMASTSTSTRSSANPTTGIHSPKRRVAVKRTMR